MFIVIALATRPRQAKQLRFDAEIRGWGRARNARRGRPSSGRRGGWGRRRPPCAPRSSRARASGSGATRWGRGDVLADDREPGVRETPLDAAAHVVEIVVSGELAEAEHPGNEVNAIGHSRELPRVPNRERSLDRDGRRDSEIEAQLAAPEPGARERRRAQPMQRERGPCPANGVDDAGSVPCPRVIADRRRASTSPRRRASRTRCRLTRPLSKRARASSRSAGAGHRRARLPMTVMPSRVAGARSSTEMGSSAALPLVATV